MAELLTIDAFAEKPFSGNPAAVCLLDRAVDSQWMQALAAELNLSETAFVAPASDPGHFHLRWFTPTVEVDLCGHATLASAKALWTLNRYDPLLAMTFHTRSGKLTAKQDDPASGLIWLDFPAKVSQQVQPPGGLIESLRIPHEVIRSVGRNQFDYIVEVSDECLVRNMIPDFFQMKQVEARGVIVTSRSDTQNSASYDFVSRFFAPQSGINEDPVTGSAHCALGPYWSGILKSTRMTGFQASKRGGFVQVNLQDDRVHLGGKAVIVSSGSLMPEAFALGI